MAGRLIVRRAAASALVVAVIAIHGCIASRVADLLAEFKSRASMPARIEVAYVREMEPAAPAQVAPPPPAPPVKRRKRVQAPPPVEPAASASLPEPQVVAEAASEPVAEPPPPASAPAEPEPPAPAAAAAASAPEFSWPSSTRVSYVLTGNYRGELHGSAQVEWIRAGMQYQMHLDVLIGLSWAPVMTRRMSSEGRLNEQGLVPERYDQETWVAFGNRRRLAMQFEPDAVVMANGSRRERWAGLQDTASQFGQFTYLFTTRPELLTPGGTVEMPLALPNKVELFVFDVLPLDSVATPFGRVEAFPLKPRGGARTDGNLSIEPWYAPSLQYLPVRLRIQQDADTFIDLVISRKPQLAAN